MKKDYNQALIRPSSKDTLDTPVKQSALEKMREARDRADFERNKNKLINRFRRFGFATLTASSVTSDQSVDHSVDKPTHPIIEDDSGPKDQPPTLKDEPNLDPKDQSSVLKSGSNSEIPLDPSASENLQSRDDLFNIPLTPLSPNVNTDDFQIERASGDSQKTTTADDILGQKNSEKSTQPIDLEKSFNANQEPDIFKQSKYEKAEIIPASTGSVKSFMGYQAIPPESNDDYLLQQSPNVYTNDNGLRCYDYDGYELPMVSVGTGITEQVGKILMAVFEREDGYIEAAYFVTGHIQANQHTDKATHTVQIYDQSVLEFLVDRKIIEATQKLATKMDDLSYFEDNNYDFSGNILSISVLEGQIKP